MDIRLERAIWLAWVLLLIVGLSDLIGGMMDSNVFKIISGVCELYASFTLMILSRKEVDTKYDD